MNRRLDTRDTATFRTADRIKVTATTIRAKHGKSVRTEHKTTRTDAHATAPDGVSMDYQMGFTSGPSV